MKNKTRDLTLSGLIVAGAVVLPMIFHMFSMGGQIFLPMHIPVLLGSFFINPVFALLAGLLSPLLSSVMTGMPPIFPIGLLMMIELSLYGFFVSFFNQRKINVFVTLILAMIIGRLGASLGAFVLSIGFSVKINALIYLKTGIITGIPGIIIQIILIPLLIKFLGAHIRR